MEETQAVRYSVSTNVLSYLICGLLAISCFSCMGVKPAASKTKPKLYETFYRGQNGNQYFIKPLSFEEEGGKRLAMDMTFRINSKAQKQDSAYINMTFFALAEKIENARIEFNNNQHQSQFENPIVLFTEAAKEGYNIRFSAQISGEEVLELLQAGGWEISLKAKGNQSTYFPLNSTNRKIEDLIQEKFQ